MEPTIANERTHQGTRILVLALLSALLLFPSLRRPGLSGHDDAVYAYEGREMVQTGDWWNIRFNGHLNFEYPPLFLWLEAGSFELLGISDGAAKFPSALLGFGTILLVYFLTLELTGQPWLSLWAMLVLASTQFFLKNATHAMTDVPFTFFFTLTIFFYLKGLKKKAYLLLLGLPLGMALLTRSVIGFIALGIIVAHLFLTRRSKLLWSPWLISGVVLAVALPSLWFISQCQLHGTASIVSHLLFVISKIHVASESPRSTIFNYPVALLKYYWPWLPFLLVGLWMAFRAARQKNQAASLLLIWVLLVFLPFSLVQTRYPRYIMPVFPAFSIVSAIALDRLIPPAHRKSFFGAACVIGALAVCLTFMFPPKVRAADIKALVPLAEANSDAQERVLIYSYEDGRTDYLDQFLWYSNRYAALPPNLNDLAAELISSQKATVIIDKPSYAKLLNLMPTKTTQILGQSENLVCFRVG
jgi:4-amino-4-deoxy-L-arabinose transferase-like glycosyltransferase